MNDSTREISPLRQRMLEDMRLRKLAPHTQASYVRAVRRLAGYLRRPPDTATVEDLRNFQLHLVDRGTSPITLNATITGLKFFFDVTLDRSELMSKMKPVFVPRTLPVVLSREEVGALIAATRNLKHQTALSIASNPSACLLEPTIPRLCSSRKHDCCCRAWSRLPGTTKYERAPSKLLTWERTLAYDRLGALSCRLALNSIGSAGQFKLSSVSLAAQRFSIRTRQHLKRRPTGSFTKSGPS
jgi:hypothetical protein